MAVELRSPRVSVEWAAVVRSASASSAGRAPAAAAGAPPITTNLGGAAPLPPGRGAAPLADVWAGAAAHLEGGGGGAAAAQRPRRGRGGRVEDQDRPLRLEPLIAPAPRLAERARPHPRAFERGRHPPAGQGIAALP